VIADLILMQRRRLNAMREVLSTYQAQAPSTQ
jgi:hypothetical protein